MYSIQCLYTVYCAHCGICIMCCLKHGAQCTLHNEIARLPGSLSVCQCQDQESKLPRKFYLNKNKFKTKEKLQILLKLSRNSAHVVTQYQPRINNGRAELDSNSQFVSECYTRLDIHVWVLTLFYVVGF